MKIVTKKVRKGYWIADIIDLCGGPVIGNGRTRLEAVACLLSRHIALKSNFNTHYLEIDGKPWSSENYSESAQKFMRFLS